MPTTNSLASQAAGTIAFLRELSRIDISTSEAVVDVSVVLGDATIFENAYVPTSEGSVAIFDLDKVIEPCFRSSPVQTFSFVIGGNAYEVTVLMAATEVSEPASDFVSGFFLTSMMHERDTAIGRYETLSFYSPSSVAPSVEASYWDGSAVRKQTLSLDAMEGLATLDVSPSRFADDSAGALIGYTVMAGDRKASYRVLPTMPAADPSVIFVNSFGCWETAYLCGTKSQSPKYTRSALMINGRYAMYDIEEVKSRTARTGILRNGLEAVFSDLARSKSVYLLNDDGTAGDEIVITDCDAKASNDDDAFGDMEFTYRRASKYTGLIEALRPPKLFDHTFDYTFN